MGYLNETTNKMKESLKNLEWKKLGEVCDVKKGTSITKTKVTEGSIPVIAGGQQPAYYHNIANRTGKTITISASGAYAGFVNYFEIPIFASDCTTIQSMDEYKLLSKYVFLMLKSQQKKVYSFQTGAGQPHVYAKDLAKIEIPVPPLPTQRKIVSILERAEKLKNLRQEANEDTNSIIQALFYEMFGNDKYLMEAIAKHVKKTDNRNPTERPTDKFKYVYITGIDNINGTIKEAKDILGKDAPSRARREIKENDIIVSTVRPNLNATALIPNELDNQICSTGFCVIRCMDTLNPKYLYTITRQKRFIDELVLRMKGASYPAVANNDVLRVKIPIPPISLQNQFASFVKKIESLKKHQKQSTEEISTLFDALMQKTFNGELV